MRINLSTAMGTGHALRFTELEIDFNQLHTETKSFNYSSMIFDDSMDKGTNRRASNVKSIGNVFILDIDEGMTLSQAIEAAKGYKSLIVTSKSHQIEKNGKINDRFRVLIPLSYRSKELHIPKEDYSGFYSFVAQYLGFNTFDKATKDIARFYYPNPLQEVHYSNNNEVLEFKTLYEEYEEHKASLKAHKSQLQPQTSSTDRNTLLSNELPINQTFETKSGDILTWSDAISTPTPVRCVFPQNHNNGDRNPSAFIIHNANSKNPRFYCTGCGASYWMQSSKEHNDFDSVTFISDVVFDDEEADKALNEMIEAQKRESANNEGKSTQGIVGSDEVIIAKDNDFNDEEVEIELKEMIENKKTIDGIFDSMMFDIPNDIDLIKVLTNDLKDKLHKYQENGEIVFTKIPDNIYIVAIIHKLKSIAKQRGWDIARENDFIYLFNGAHWVQCQKDDLYRFFKQITIKMRFYSPAKAETAKFKEDMYKQFIASAEFYKCKLQKGTVLLNCKNGTLEVTEKGVKLRPHNKEDFLKYVLPFEYNKDAKAPIFERYLDEVLNTETQKVLQEFCGYIFVSNLKLEKCLVCYGSGANGKSVFFEVITSLLGADNIATKSLGDLTDNNQGSYNRAMIKDALVNYGSEIKGKNIDVDIFKRLVSGEPVQARLPYGQPFDLINNTKFMFNANELPQIDEHNEAVFRRFIIIPFNKTIPKERRDAELHNKIKKSELSGVLNWVLLGLERLLQSKKFSEVQEIEDALLQYKKESDSVALFVDEKEYIVSKDVDDFMNIQNLYDDYKEQMKHDGKYALSKNNFSARLSNLGFMSYRYGQKRGFLIG